MNELKRVRSARTAIQRNAPPRRQRGVSLIEVLVAVVVLGIGLLGTAALQATALRGGQSSFESSMAVAQTNSILEAMRANRANAGSYNIAQTCGVPAAGGSRAQQDIRVWLTDLKRSVGGRTAADVSSDTTTCGTIANCPLDCTITVQWDDGRAGGGVDRQVTTRTRI